MLWGSQRKVEYLKGSVSEMELLLYSMDQTGS